MFGPLLGLGIGALGQAFGSGQKRKQSQAELDALFKRDENKFLAENPNFEQDATWQRKRRGFSLDPNSFKETFDDQGRSQGMRLDPFALSQGMANSGGGQFMRDLQNSEMSDIQRPDYKAPKLPGGFMSDLFGSLLSNAGPAIGAAFGGGGPKPGDPGYIDIG